MLGNRADRFQHWPIWLGQNRILRAFRMIRHVRDLLSLICIPLLVMVIIMWARSYFVLDRLTYRSTDNEDCHLRSDCGHVTWFWTTPMFPHRPEQTQLIATDLPDNSFSIMAWESLGFHHEYSQLPGRNYMPSFQRSLTVIPYWSLFMLMGVAPMWRGAAFLRRFRW